MTSKFFKLIAAVSLLISMSVSGYGFDETTTQIEEIIKQSRIMESKNQGDLEANLEQFQIMMLKEFFLKHLYSDDVSILDEEEQDELGSFGMQGQQKAMLMDEFAKQLAKRDPLGLKKQLVRELSSGTTSSRY